MARFDLIGPSYSSQSPLADAETCINWYPETMESGGARSKAALYPRAGLLLFCTLPKGPVRGEIEVNGRFFAVGGDKFYEVKPDGTATELGTVAKNANMASLAASAIQVVIVSGGHLYCYTLNPSSFAEVTAFSPPTTTYPIVASPGGLTVPYGAPNDIFSISESGSIVTLLSGSPFPSFLGNGDAITVAGVAESGYDGDFSVTGTGTAGMGTATFGDIAEISETGTTVSVLVQVHGDVPADWASLSIGGAISITGTPVAGYNGVHKITGKNSVEVPEAGRWDLTLTFEASTSDLPTASAGTVQYGATLYSLTYTNPTTGLADSAGGTVKCWYLAIQTVSPEVPIVAEDQVTVAGATNSAYDGTYTVSLVTSIDWGGYRTGSIYCHAGTGLLALGGSGGGTIKRTGTDIAQCAYCDGYFLIRFDSSQQWNISALMDGTSWDALDTSRVSEIADDIVSLLVDHREVILFGRTKTVVYYDSGNPDFPFDVVPGGYIEQGCVAPFSPCRLDNSAFWLGRDERGAIIAWRAQGYLPVRVSNHTLEQEWQQYSAASDAISYAVQWLGHTFWVIYFPTADKTWVYDTATGVWHREGSWNGSDYTALHAQCHAFAFGKHLVGDWASGAIYEMSAASYDDFGNPIRWERRSPSIGTELEWMQHERIQIDLDVGIGQVFEMPAITVPPSGGDDIIGGGRGYVPPPDPAPVTAVFGGSLNHYAAPILMLFPYEPPALPQATYGVLLLEIVGGRVIGFSDKASIAVTNDSSFLRVALPHQATGLTWRVCISNDNWATAYYVDASGAPEADTGKNIGAMPTTSIAPPRAPQLFLRWSDDGAKTWSNGRVLTCGTLGNYRARVIARRLGRSRHRIYEISAFDPVPWRIIEGYLTASPGFTPIERLSKNIGKSA